MSHQTEAFEGKLAVVGLGYVGLPLAVAFSEIMDVIGYDVDAQTVSYTHLTLPTTRSV